MKFVAVMGFIFSGFALLAGIFMLAGFSLVPQQTSAYSLPHGVFVLMALIYIFVAALYFVPSLILFRYAASLDRIEHDGTWEKLAKSLEHQRKFWKYVGVCLIVSICLWLLSMIGLVVFSMAMAAHHLH
ncbi:MAG: DUF5362 family protein [Gammaproteobacteria bacterium]